MHKIIYKILDKYFQNDFSNDLTAYLKESEEPLIVFDVGCYVGNFSRKIKKKLVNKKIEFYLFDPNPKLEIKDFSYNNIALSNKKGNFDYHLNTFFPSSGSSLKTFVKDDKLWNFSRKIVTLSLFKAFETFKVKVDLLDNYCNEKKITKIDLLKIDVEGSEIDVLEGSANILKNTNVILIEIFDKKNKYEKKMSKIKSMLLELNFELKKIKSTWSSQQMSNTKSADALFVKRNISSL